MIEDMREAYQRNPQSVPASWRALFAGNTNAVTPAPMNTPVPYPHVPPTLPHPQATASHLSQPVAASPAAAEDHDIAAVEQPLSAVTAAQYTSPTPDFAAARSGAAPHRQASMAQDVTRSDLPPAPASDVAPPSSPYAARMAAARHALDDHHGEDSIQRLKGAAARTATNMEASLAIPTATSARAIPAKVMIENRSIVNAHLSHTRGGKISFTHIIGWAIVEALVTMPEMNVSFTQDENGKNAIRHNAHVGFGLAVDVPAPGGERRLVVPNVKNADTLEFSSFVAAYEKLVEKARTGSLGIDDFQGTTITLTNPGMIGTLHSVPRLMPGQGAIIGVGSMAYPAGFAGASDETLARQGVGKVLTLTSTYDHRVIQGAQSGEFLRLIENKLLGLDGFWDRIFESLRIPHQPMRWQRDVTYDELREDDKPARVAQLIHAFRQRGHLAADTDPLTYRVRRHPDLDITSYGLSLWDLDRTFPTSGLGTKPRATLREILDLLRDAYCRTVGVEYMHIQDPAQRRWWQDRLEGKWTDINQTERTRILTMLGQAEAFEVFLQTKYVGQKRFSLEGGESLIVLLDQFLDAAAHDNRDEVVIGMAHRGRLNVLTNIAGKSYGQVFDEFDGRIIAGGMGTGDVKYHLGTQGVFTGTDGVTTRVSLAANPSHLETVDGVVEGIARAKMDRMARNGELNDNDYPVVPVLVHGDAAFAGQGVVYETLNMSQLPAYRTGGTVHIIVNNQIGFTTGAAQARSTTYCTDLAKGLQVPIFHVNADDPETVARVARRAYEYRAAFHKDVIIDLVCYRRRGHNEGDDPSMTQPVMYKLINGKASTREVYTKDLVGRGHITVEQATAIDEAYRSELERILNERRDVRAHENEKSNKELGLATACKPSTVAEVARRSGVWTSAVSSRVIERIGDAQVAYPTGFNIHPKLAQMLAKRQEMSRNGDIDWGFGELLALGSILMDGIPVRLAGEDARRATFAQRHAVLHDHLTGQEWTPLDFLTPTQAPLELYDSLLSEYATMAFEYGYSVERTEGLTMWEAQFGDFANGAQTVIDEFISSSGQKWGEESGLVLLLPHGLEGQGPDHSSARIERYLQLCAQDNMRVVQPSTPANHFHMLRDQAFRQPRKPLIVLTPKQLLRLKAATSSVDDFTSGSFQTVIGDSHPRVLAAAERGDVERVLLCSGRIYYDLLARRDKDEDFSTAIVRLEQIYPLDEGALFHALEPFGDAQLVWVQDEPKNQGVWPWLVLHMPMELTGGRMLPVVARPETAAPAVGTAGEHKRQLVELINTAFQR
ncbi:multifunctional oxoglutarate decarboxylase/oxoglutarate dehydrogenase thiamine pyrophosphate-binding subunit/dihydrolipoyllysine-residue succinyltransferase subunit [Actinomyces vulturis]|uniref:multifunctional oxoglutarate decarboxylase/oxoglutarate dehydrogenase thiamine pyrophosphate-binding subunit/dihydrolipoyllysine-residue succinyltransferase subunit n=1 Tax=Actinomyces vulturis TaxID=1857645 RepID=UPI003CCC30A9